MFFQYQLNESKQIKLFITIDFHLNSFHSLSKGNFVSLCFNTKTFRLPSERPIVWTKIDYENKFEFAIHWVFFLAFYIIINFKYTCYSYKNK